MEAPGQAVIVMALRLYTGTARLLYIHVSLLSLSQLNTCGNASCYYFCCLCLSCVCQFPPNCRSVHFFLS